MSNIKKAYIEIVELLEANANKKVSTILPQILEMCQAKTATNIEGKTFHKDANDEVIAIHCYYFKKWFKLTDVEFGAKKSTASGYNTMCKRGVSLWTKQQRVAKQTKEALLDKLMNGELTADELPQAQADIEEARKAIQEDDIVAAHGYDTLEDLLAAS